MPDQHAGSIDRRLRHCRDVQVLVREAAAPSVAAKNATSTIPIVFSGVSDPVGSVPFIC
jgi:ABC-type uncharacterized transport system substrate-binding protein